MNLQEGLESTIALTIYDVIEKRGIPDMKKVGSNLGGSFLYEFVGKRINYMISQKLLPNFQKEAQIAGRIIWTPVGMGIIEQYVLSMGSPNWGKLFMKSMVSIGALSLWKML
jgi:hypothetical protein